MPLRVSRITLWRSDVENVPGVLANALEPFAEAGVPLRLVMGYRFPRTPEHSAIEVAPIEGRRAKEAAERGGLKPSDIPCLLVEGDDRPGLGAAIGRACAEAGINIAFFMAMAIGRRFAAAIGFPDDEAARNAVRVVRKAAGAPRRPAGAARRRRSR
ncbi:MAG TPA: hypothetical protein VFD84_15365 [Candidatus Binatia bacterium]|jgi:hypothetical protein|nr:hypothetical protein [Candidatus Binatia bacterium]